MAQDKLRLHENHPAIPVLTPERVGKIEVLSGSFLMNPVQSPVKEQAAFAVKNVRQEWLICFVPVPSDPLKGGSIVLPAREGQFDVLILVLSRATKSSFCSQTRHLNKIARTGTVKMPNFLASWQPLKRRDAGAAERTGLENRSRGNSTGGSNPPLSATLSMTYLPTSRLAFPKQNNRRIFLKG